MNCAVTPAEQTMAVTTVERACSRGTAIGNRGHDQRTPVDRARKVTAVENGLNRHGITGLRAPGRFLDARAGTKMSRLVCGPTRLWPREPCAGKLNASGARRNAHDRC